MTELRNLCVKILKEFFGDVPSQIGSELSWGPKTLPLIKSALKLPLAKVSLLHLLKIQRKRRILFIIIPS